MLWTQVVCFKTYIHIHYAKTTQRAGTVWGEAKNMKKKPFSSPPFFYSHNLRRPPSRYTWKSKWPRAIKKIIITVRRAISWRSHAKTGNREQSSQIPEFIQYISSRFFENQPKEICSHLCEKASKGTFIKPEKLQNQINKEKERRKGRARRGKGGEEKKAMVS